jgi:hypothetical protein
LRSSKLVLIIAFLFAAPLQSFASGPRWVTGPPFFNGPYGVAVGWKQTRLLYFTDPGNLSSTVNHQAADALVAAAASVWNVPVANITLAQGGSLAEHVNGQNVYLDSTGMHFPTDASIANANAVPIAVIYDSDGSVTDTLLGAGASDPSGCRQNAVTESVDAFDPAGYILHALIVINGRCTGSAPEMQLQLRYQLMRVFGRVLGLAWSQTNDNVFTGIPTPTNIQAQNWPILHPLDILCGPYSYQCLPNPFQLRTDDISSMVLVYPISAGMPLAPGKHLSFAGAQGVEGWISFPTGQGMAGVNVVVRREAAQTTVPDSFYISSAVTGTYFRRAAHSPFVNADNSPAASFGSPDQGELGHYLIGYFPMLGNNGWENLFTSTETINPLYTGESSLGPYIAGDVAPGGSAPPAHTSFVTGEGRPQVNFTIADAPAACGAGGDGTPSAAAQVAASGWWNGLLCGYGHASYLAANVKPGRTFTLEVTALDEQGLATDSKAMPVIGLYAATDGPDALPSLAVTPAAFNALTFGTTTLSAPTAHATSLRFGIADQRGDGRPDFGFQGRFFYADDVSPARIAPTGGKLTITGSGFRKGNAVTINGANADVISWSANEIVVTAPTQTASNATSGTAVDIVVLDHGTGASSTISAALIYGPQAGLPNSMRLLSAPSGTALIGDPADTTFSVQVVAPDGSTPISGDAIAFSAPVGAARFSACSAATCTVLTDASGIASTTVTPVAAGPITLQASDGSLSQSAAFMAKVQATSMALLSTPESPIRVGNPSSNWFAIQVLGPDGRTGLAARLVTLSVLSGTATFRACSTSPCVVTTDQWGFIGMPVTPTSVGTITVQAADGDVKQTATFTAISNADTIQVISVPNAVVSLGDEAGLFSIRLLQSNGTQPDAQRTVTFSAPSDINFEICGSNICQVTTDWGGQASVMPYPKKVGTYSLQVSYGDVVQTVSFTVTTRLPQLKVLSAPPDNSASGVVASTPFSVRLLKPDGVTPLTGVTVTMSGAPGTVMLPACGLASCEIRVDGNGVASTPVMPLHSGPISISATYSPLVQTVTFNAAGGGESMRIVTQPGPAGVPFGQAQTLTVQVIGPDGVTPMSWDPVTFTLLSGPFGLVGSAGASYTAHTDGSGMVSCSGIAVGSGPVIVQVADPLVSQIINFIAGTSADVMHLLSAPSGSAHVGSAAALPFAVQVFTSDGPKPAVAKNVTFSVTNGGAHFGACSNASCVVQTDANGIASTTVIPISTGNIGLLAADGNVTQATSFIGVPASDILNLLSAPASGGYPGVVAALPFSVQAFHADGVTPASAANVTISVTNNNATLASCAGAASCVLQADAKGVIATAVTPLSTGTVTLTAVDGDTALSTNFNVVAKPDVMRLISAPAGNLAVGKQSATAFAVRMLAGDGVTPLAGKPVTFSATFGTVQFTACGSASCVVSTDSDGIASSGVIPLAPGTDTIVATQGALSQSASFNSVSVPDTLRVMTAPSSGSFTGLAAATPFTVQLLEGDSTTPAVGKNVTVSISNGSATLSACMGAVSCVLTTDANGTISTFVTPASAGSIKLLATVDQLSATASFTAVDRSDSMSLLSSPSGQVHVGALASVPFTVQIFSGDGVTPQPGKTVVFSATAGTVRFGACGAPTCSVTTAADGTATTTVTPIAAGNIALLASEGGLTATASFQAIANQYSLTSTSSPVYLAEGATANFVFTALAAENGSPAPDQPVHWTPTAGLQPVTVDSVTNAAGSTSLQAQAGPLQGKVQSAMEACAWTNICTTFYATGVSASEFHVTIVSGAQQEVANSAPLLPVVVQVTDNLGHPVAGAPISIFQTVTAMTADCPDRGRCPAAPVLCSQVSVVDADANGQTSIVPLMVPGQATQTEILVSSGTKGAASTVLTERP